jgi:hypothetical protein
VSTTTAQAIRDRIITVVQGTVPTVYPVLPFAAYRDESGADFRRWARSHPQTCTRRFQARLISSVQASDVSNVDVEVRLATFDILVAYAKRWRAGASFDRDNTMASDQTLIEHTVGRNGYGNFNGAFPNASWLSPDASGSQTETLFERDDGKIDFLVIRQTMRFYRNTIGP